MSHFSENIQVVSNKLQHYRPKGYIRAVLLSEHNLKEVNDQIQGDSRVVDRAIVISKIVPDGNAFKAKIVHIPIGQYLVQLVDGGYTSMSKDEFEEQFELITGIR